MQIKKFLLEITQACIAQCLDLVKPEQTINRRPQCKLSLKSGKGSCKIDILFLAETDTHKKLGYSEGEKCAENFESAENNKVLICNLRQVFGSFDGQSNYIFYALGGMTM